jgi:hypothetical protein
MPQQSHSRDNFFGFGKRETVHKSGGVSKRDMESQAFKAGQRSGDTGQFREWARSKNLSKWGDSTRDFEGAYRKGVERGEQKEARKEAKREAVQEKKEAKHEQKLEVSKVVTDVTDALTAQGLAKGKAQQLARTRYAKGDSFDDLWRKVVAKVPKENPRASTKALTGAGYRLVDRYSDRSVAMDVARNYVPYRVVYQTPGGTAAKWEVWTKQSENPRGSSAARQLAKDAHVNIAIASAALEAAGGNAGKAHQALKDLRAEGRINPQTLNPKGGKFDRCVQDVKKSGSAVSPYAVCEKTVGRSNGQRAATPGQRETNTLRENPKEAAEKLYKDFTGLPANKITEVTEREHFHKFTTKYGTLVCLDILTVQGKIIPLVATGFKFEPARYLPMDVRDSGEAEKVNASWILKDGAKQDSLVGVTFTEDGKQMIFRGGDQEIPYKQLGLTDRDVRDNMFIGTIVQITYRGKKKFEMDGKEEVDFHHPFGEQGSGGIMPLLLYKPRVKRMETAGGRYYTAPVRKDIGASPGIVG